MVCLNGGGVMGTGSIYTLYIYLLFTNRKFFPPIQVLVLLLRQHFYSTETKCHSPVTCHGGDTSGGQSYDDWTMTAETWVGRLLYSTLTY